MNQTEIKEDLYPHQSNALDRLNKYMESDDFAFLLDGSAGSGKTFLITRFIDNFRNKSIAMTAPTNKAVHILRTMNRSNVVTYKTIHSLCGLRMIINENGEEVFERDPSISPKINEIDLLIVDEVSQVSKKLFEFIEPYIQNGLKTIFVGDRNQLPPVNEKESLVYRDDRIIKHSLEVIVRQKEGSPIIDLAQHILKKGDVSKFTTTKEGIFSIPKNSLVPLVSRIFKEYKTNTDSVKVLGWTNAFVNSMNKLIRFELYGAASKNKLIVGEKIIADKTIVDGDAILYSTNEELTVNDLDIVELENGLKHYNVSVTNYRGAKETIRIVHEDSESDFKRMRSNMYKYASNLQYGTNARKEAFKQYHLFVRYFARIKYNYAITVHKAQGSTYKTAIVGLSDIGRNYSEYRELLYTAVTRASDSIIFIK